MFKLLQWNIFYEEKAANVIELIKQVDADFVCLQEVTKTSDKNPDVDIPTQIEELGYHGYYQATISRPDLIMGNGIFAKQSLKDAATRYTQLSDGSRDYTKENRAYLSATVDCKGKPLQLGTVHLSYNPYFEQTTRREMENNKFLDYLATDEKPQIFCGDFNATPDSRLITELTKRYTHAGPDFNQKTWTTKPFEHESFKATRLDWRLDYVFCSENVQIHSSEIVQTEYSDHLPILVSFDLTA